MFEYLVLCGDGISFLNLRFENDVKMYGTQTLVLPVPVCKSLRMM